MSSSSHARLRSLAGRRPSVGRYAGALIGLLALCTFLSITQPVFLTWDNFSNIVAANSVIFILAAGATFVILAAGLDLSVAAAMTSCAMILGITMRAGWPVGIAIAATVAFGTALGLVNGLLIGRAKLSFFVVTLGTLSIFSSFPLVVNNGNTISVFNLGSFGPLSALVNNSVGPITALMLLSLVILVVCGVVLKFTTYGQAVYAVGSNPEAARLTGIRVTLVIVSVYTLGGFFAGVGSLVQVGRLTGASPTVDPTLLLTVLAAVLIGGTAPTGGEGGIFGTFIGALFLGVIQNGLALSNVSSFWQGSISGLILIAAVALAAIRTTDRGRWRGKARRDLPGHALAVTTDDEPAVPA